MIDKILKSRYEQVQEFAKDTENRLELLQFRLLELKEEESLLKKLIDIYSQQSPDPFSIKDKTVEEILKGLPKNVKPQISPELVNALDALEKHKKDIAEQKLRKELEPKIRKEIEPVIMEELRDEVNESLNMQKLVIEKITEILGSDDFKEEKPTALESVNKEVGSSPSKSKKSSSKAKKSINKKKAKKEYKKPEPGDDIPPILFNGIVSTEAIRTEISEYLKSKSEPATLNELTDYFNTKYPTLRNFWDVKKGLSNHVFKVPGIKSRFGEGEYKRIKFYYL